MKSFSLLKTVWMFVFCCAMAIASPAQTFTTLVSFDGTDGAYPLSSLIQGTDGNFYGTTQQGAAYGTVFKITPSGTLTTLHSFCSQPNCADGSYPIGGLVQATDGNFYGTANGGGDNGQGTVFKMTPSGTLKTLYSFCPQTGCADGASPYAALVQATDGSFYGTTFLGGRSGGNCGSGGCGTVFKITAGGTLTTLHSFAGTDGTSPVAGLVQATDGNFYGTTEFGGVGGVGSVFKITPAGMLTTLHSFDRTDGAIPIAGLVQATDGNFYGTTELGGAGGCIPGGCGTVFKITPAGLLTTVFSLSVITNE